MMRKENIAQENQALCVAAANRMHSVVTYILTHHRATVNISYGGWLVFRTPSVKIQEQLYNHYIDTHDSVDYNYEETEMFEPFFILSLHQAPDTETRRNMLKQHIDEMRASKRAWKAERAQIIEELLKFHPCPPGGGEGAAAAASQTYDFAMNAANPSSPQ
jgi:hypothetical protein